MPVNRGDDAYRELSRRAHRDPVVASLVRSLQENGKHFGEGRPGGPLVWHGPADGLLLRGRQRQVSQAQSRESR